MQFYDASLFGRKGRCPKCRHKFVLHKPEAVEPQPLGNRLNVSPAALKQMDSPVGNSSLVKVQEPSASATSAGPAEQGQTWDMNMNRGLGIRRPTLPPRWVFPNALAISTQLVIAVGAAIGMGTASLILKDCPVFLLVAAAAVGETIAICFRIRKCDPLR
jgi:hypothetical protein